jgi:hypothetical protein
MEDPLPGLNFKESGFQARALPRAKEDIGFYFDGLGR